MYNNIPVFSDLEVDFSLDIQRPEARELYNYWYSKCGSGLPTWADLSLMDVYKLSPDIMVKEMVDGGREWKNRYFGSGLTRNLGVEATNKLLIDYHDPENAEKARKFFNMIRDRSQPVRVAGRCIVINRDFKYFEGMYMPLNSVDGSVDMIMCIELYA